ncbi:YfhO family protein [Pedobacter sp. SYSU D00535]|uniref:YfhO family protein n=1 Tax=Pedobacter sp. SYSU D00535 TaxID=2810308 RepID=UPI001A969B34|nr:YfhO family protein [Pedobacter sp. SYSU D00535]
MTNWFKRNGTHLAIIGLFIVLCFIYFSPALQGKALSQHDVLQAKGMQKEIMDYKASEGKAPLWTNSMFGGMPAFQIWAQYPNNIATHIVSFFKIVFPNPIDTVLLYLLGAYLLFCVLKVRPWLAAAGAIAFAFTSYNFQIIEAGHSNKAFAIAFFAPILAGIILTLRGKYLLGASLTALFLAIEIRANHIQMTYYLFLAILILVGVELYNAIKKKETKAFFKSIAYLAVAAMISVGVNASMLWTTYEYGQESTRGKSNLKTEGNAPSNGLDREYAYGWSQGVGEIVTFLVPNAYGGASAGGLDEDSKVAKTLIERGVPAEQATGFAKQLPTYWGEKQFTAGPYYFGAIVCLLFVLGLFIVRGPLKWWIVGATILTILLSFGKHFPLVSDLFFNYFPLYNKFRAVESILAVTGFLFPILAILAVKEITTEGLDKKDLIKKLQYSIYIVGGLLLILIIFPSLLLAFRNSGHEDLIQQLTQITGGDASFATSIANALIEDRESLARMDALRSLIFVLIGAALTWALIQKKLQPQVAFIILTVAILVDMWSVDKRYLNNENFVEPTNMVFEPRQVDELILRDQGHYRVIDLTESTFQSARASYFHKSIGGYHAAKLKRFQEVIDKQFNNSINEDVLDMLNTKYAITMSQDGQSQRIQNRETAAGNAWFVTDVLYVKSNEQEMEAISSFDPKKEAIVHESFKSLIDEKKLGTITNSSIELVSYKPDHLVYEYTAPNDLIAVFSEIWYDKGWNAYVDGNKIPYFRANYLLRAAQLPGGNHKVEFKFEPASYYSGETVSLISSILLVGGLGFAGFSSFRRRKEEEEKA